MTELEKMLNESNKILEKMTELNRTTKQWLDNRKGINNDALLCAISEFEKIGINPIKHENCILEFDINDNLKVIVSYLNCRCIVDLYYYNLHSSYVTSNIKISNVYDIMFLDIKNIISIDLANELKKGGK